MDKETKLSCQESHDFKCKKKTRTCNRSVKMLRRGGSGGTEVLGEIIPSLVEHVENQVKIASLYGNK